VVVSTNVECLLNGRQKRSVRLACLTLLDIGLLDIA